MKTALLLISLCCFNFASKASDSEKDILSEMRFFRNEIFARHGRAFISVELQEYFKLKSWYKSDDNFNVNKLSEKEKLAVSTIKKIEDAYSQMSTDEQQTCIEIYHFIKSNVFSRLDTLVLTVENFDNKAGKDTITTKIYEQEFGVFNIDYSLIKNGMVVWKDSFSNPYLWLGDHEFFNDWSNHFILGYLATKFEIAQSEDMWDLPIDTTVLEMGVNALKHYGHDTNLTEYEEYVHQFKGKLLLYCINESGGKLEIWYEPLKRFITFYAP